MRRCRSGSGHGEIRSPAVLTCCADRPVPARRACVRAARIRHAISAPTRPASWSASRQSYGSDNRPLGRSASSAARTPARSNGPTGIWRSSRPERRIAGSTRCWPPPAERAQEAESVKLYFEGAQTELGPKHFFRSSRMGRCGFTKTYARGCSGIFWAQVSDPSKKSLCRGADW